MGVLLDTTFLIDLLRGDAAALTKGKAIQAGGVAAHLPAPAVFEVLTGIHFKRSRMEAGRFERLTSRFPVLAFDDRATRYAAEVRAELYRQGRIKAPTDTMIAGIALHHRHALVTRDKGFSDVADIMGLEVEAY